MAWLPDTLAPKPDAEDHVGATLEMVPCWAKPYRIGAKSTRPRCMVANQGWRYCGNAPKHPGPEGKSKSYHQLPVWRRREWMSSCRPIHGGETGVSEDWGPESKRHDTSEACAGPGASPLHCQGGVQGGRSSVLERVKAKPSVEANITDGAQGCDGEAKCRQRHVCFVLACQLVLALQGLVGPGPGPGSSTHLGMRRRFLATHASAQTWFRYHKNGQALAMAMAIEAKASNVDVPAPLAALAYLGPASVRGLLGEVSEETCLRTRTLIAKPASIVVGCVLDVCVQVHGRVIFLAMCRSGPTQSCACARACACALTSPGHGRWPHDEALWRTWIERDGWLVSLVVQADRWAWEWAAKVVRLSGVLVHAWLFPSYVSQPWCRSACTHGAREGSATHLAGSCPRSSGSVAWLRGHLPLASPKPTTKLWPIGPSTLTVALNGPCV
ncbi:hypothetical protein COCMIDRAFT_28020 [Bipolaris oryzae ATCC 44560]|uniref:Uncharacterized protein n=1 Tax=Bipolaris oryzae ATCC 44560 TaxID=930090 RepID=W6Z7E2_COCMI|nr:uncharacterized protein COCMIDRAFT_28020 [Bipolaris oryzae ATCC 44560]EUC43494.1 hypothetical protein COCMIDRAFT_28020 [Bipolaris oryzae ATCC 44560]